MQIKIHGLAYMNIMLGMFCLSTAAAACVHAFVMLCVQELLRAMNESPFVCASQGTFSYASFKLSGSMQGHSDVLSLMTAEPCIIWHLCVLLTSVFFFATH
jgi:hypothetical protein